jgi:glucosamine--fructose-6-phosphate aminotransferase (isomerizing)
MLAVLDRLRERRAELLLVGGPAGEPGERRLPVSTDGLVEELFPIVEILPLQQLAIRRGGDPDVPRGPAKVTRTW